MEERLQMPTVQISVRDKNLFSCERQEKTNVPTCLSSEIAEAAMKIFKTKYKMTSPLRSVGVRACDLVSANSNVQLSLFYDFEKQKRMENLETAIDDLRARFGYFAVQRGAYMVEPELTGHNPKEHVIHPLALFNETMQV